MSESIITPAVIYTSGGVAGAGHLLDMLVDAVVLGAVVSAAVTMISESKNRWLAMAYTIIGGLLDGALVPPLAHFLIGEVIGNHPPLGEQCLQLTHVFVSVVVGLLWQVLLKFVRTVWPSFENYTDNAVEWPLNLLPRRLKK